MLDTPPGGTTNKHRPPAKEGYPLREPSGIPRAPRCRLSTRYSDAVCPRAPRCRYARAPANAYARIPAHTPPHRLKRARSRRPISRRAVCVAATSRVHGRKYKCGATAAHNSPLLSSTSTRLAATLLCSLCRRKPGNFLRHGTVNASLGQIPDGRLFCARAPRASGAYSW
jgi:hypothetical protein